MPEQALADLLAATGRDLDRIGLFVDGRVRRTESRLDVVDPASGTVFATAPDAAPADLDDAMGAAARALPGWAADEPARRDALRGVAAELRARADELVPILTAEQGKTLAEARREFQRSADWFDYYAGLDDADEVIQDDERAFVRTVHRPVGVVAAIAPWNFPITLASYKLAPALRAGATVVLKPSP